MSVYRIADGSSTRLDVVIDATKECPIRVRVMNQLQPPDDGYRFSREIGVVPGAARGLAQALNALADEMDPARADVWAILPLEDA
jgi:hypothetical protein